MRSILILEGTHTQALYDSLTHTHSLHASSCVRTLKLLRACCEVLPANPRVLRRLPAFSSNGFDPPPSPLLRKHRKSKESKIFSLSVAIDASIGTATDYHVQPTLLLCQPGALPTPPLVTTITSQTIYPFHHDRCILDRRTTVRAKTIKGAKSLKHILILLNVLYTLYCL